METPRYLHASQSLGLGVPWVAGCLPALMTIVGALGLTSAMSMGVLERTGELGVMRAVGATPAMVLRVILARRSPILTEAP
jgi:hypothetical protein